MAIDATQPDLLDSALPPAPGVAVHLKELILAATDRAPDDEATARAVRHARDAGEGWEIISVALGLTPTEARARYGESAREPLGRLSGKRSSAD